MKYRSCSFTNYFTKHVRNNTNCTLTQKIDKEGKTLIFLMNTIILILKPNKSIKRKL